MGGAGFTVVARCVNHTAGPRVQAAAVVHIDVRLVVRCGRVGAARVIERAAVVINVRVAVVVPRAWRHAAWDPVRALRVRVGGREIVQRGRIAAPVDNVDARPKDRGMAVVCRARDPSDGTQRSSGASFKSCLDASRLTIEGNRIRAPDDRDSVDAAAVVDRGGGQVIQSI